MSDGALGFWGNVVGGTLGVMGAFLAALYAARKTREQDQKRSIESQKQKEKEKEEAKVVTYRRAISLAESSLQSHMIQMHTNTRLLRNCVRHIKTQGIMANLPRVVKFDALDIQNFQNLELMNKWLQLSILAQQVNNLIDDFREYYLRTTESVRSLQLQVPTGKKLEDHMNANIIKSDYEVLAEFGEKVVTANIRLIESTEDILATITHHTKMASDKKLQTIPEINDYRITLENYEQELNEIKQRFNPEETFENLGTNG